MHLTKSLVSISALIASTCFARITIETSQPDESGLIEAAVKILESCYGNRVTSLGLAGDSVATIGRKLWSRGSFSVTLVDARIVNVEPVAPQFRHKLQVFVVTSSSSLNTAKTLGEIKASTWWNHMAAFLVLEWPSSNDECTNAFDMMWAAWQMNILNAKLMCHHRVKGRLIYTFNPYTSRAPESWRLDKIYHGKNDHPWTLFVRVHVEDEGMCDELDFERANDLGGYEVRISVTGASYGQDSKVSKTSCVGLYEDMHCRLLLPALNATPKVLQHGSFNDMGYMDEKGNPHGILAEVTNGSSDIGISFRYLSSLPNITTSYPHWETELGCLTRYRGYKSQLSKIRSVIDSNSKYGLYLVCLITVLFFKYFSCQPLTIASLSTVRMICNASVPKVPTKVAPRIYLTSLFLFATTMQGIYQGQLASLLTKQEPLRNVNTIKDLGELGHTIYGVMMFRTLFSNVEVARRFVGITDFACTEYVLNNSNAACLSDKRALIYNATKFKLHLSHDSWLEIPGVFPIRPDWPVEQRLNTLLMRLVAAHHIQYQYEQVSAKTRRLLESQRSEMGDRSPKVLTLKLLGFAFVTLGIGLGCATVSFVMELGLGRYRPGIVGMLKRFR